MQGYRFYPRGLLGEMLLGVFASMVIGIGFSILAAAFILILAGGGERIESERLPTYMPLAAPLQSSPQLAAVLSK